jgi:hypothetical protein
MDLYNEILHWSLGVITSAEPDDEQLKHALVRADNAQFTSIASGKAKPKTRDGLSLVNQTPLSNTSATAGPVIIGGGHYPYKAAGVTTNYTLVVQANGDVHLLLDDGSGTTIAPTESFVGLLGADIGAISTALMSNRLFVLDTEGGSASLKNDAEVAWGVPVPTGLSLAAGAAGGMTGDYEIRITGWNNQTAAESDVSDIATITLAAQKLDITVDAEAVGDTHLFFRVYIRKPVLGAQFFRVLSGTGYDATEQGFPLASAGATVSTTIDLSDGDIEGLLLPPPQLNAHGLPPSGGKYVAVFARRLFVADSDGVYWSELDKPDAFNPASYEPIKSRDPRGGDVVGMRVHNKKLHIFTETARITLTGDADLRSWIWDTEDATVGAVADSAIVTYEKVMVWWDKESGPVLLDSADVTQFIGHDRIRAQVGPASLNVAELSKVRLTALDGRVVFAVPELSQTRRTLMLSFHTELGNWESTRWDPMDPGVIFASVTTGKEDRLYLGNYNGQLFRLLDGNTDGVRSGTNRGTFVAAGTSVSSISDAEAAFDVSGAGLIERKVTILDADGLPITGSQRPRITANNATSITLSDAVSGLEEGETYTYLIGGADMVVETYWDHLGAPFVKKRFDRVFFEFRAAEGVAEINVAVAVNFDSTQTRDTNVSEELSDSASGIWDLSDWDAFYWDGPAEVTYSLPVIKSGRNYRVQFRSPYPEQSITILKVGMLAHRLADRYRRAF